MEGHGRRNLQGDPRFRRLPVKETGRPAGPKDYKRITRRSQPPRDAVSSTAGSSCGAPSSRRQRRSIASRRIQGVRPLDGVFARQVSSEQEWAVSTSCRAASQQFGAIRRRRTGGVADHGNTSAGPINSLMATSGRSSRIGPFVGQARRAPRSRWDAAGHAARHRGVAHHKKRE